MKIILAALAVLIQIDSYSQKKNNLPDITKHETGKCYAKASINDEPSEWKQVVCNSDLDNHLINRIQGQLLKREYLSKPFEPYLDQKTRKALFQFQSDNNLSTGKYIFLETLDALDVVILTQRQRDGFFTYSISVPNEIRLKRLEEINFYLLSDPEYQAEIKIKAKNHKEFKKTKQSLTNQLIKLGWNTSDFVFIRN